jgi:thiamine-phosphate pyrophosphorylase
LLPFIEEVVAGGVNFVQIREKDLSLEELYKISAQLSDRLQEDLLISVNVPTCTDILGANNFLHFGESIDIGFDNCKRRFGQSVHSVEKAVQSQKRGASYIIAGTIYSSKSHLGESGAGLDYLDRVSNSVNIPTIAIGGINETNAGDVIKAGASGIAVISSLLESKHPYNSAVSLSKTIRSAWRKNG